MNQYQVNATITKREVLGAGIYRLTMKAPDIAQAAKPGQFIMVKAGCALDPLLRRPFSINQVMANGTLQILFKVVGRGTDYLSKLEVDNHLDIVGPLGNSFSLPSAGGSCLVGGGVGVAPLFFLAKTLLRSPKKRDIIVIIGARNAREVTPLLSDFNELGVTVFHATDDGSSGHHGFVTDILASSILSCTQDSWRVVSCGPMPMMAQVANICRLNSWPCEVSLETTMACGIGACLGCTVEAAGGGKLNGLVKGGYLHVCKDGPVFEAEEILWPR